MREHCPGICPHIAKQCLCRAGIFCSLIERESTSQFANLLKTVQVLRYEFLSLSKAERFRPVLTPLSDQILFPTQSELVAYLHYWVRSILSNKWVSRGGGHRLIAHSEGEPFDDCIIIVFIRCGKTESDSTHISSILRRSGDRRSRLFTKELQIPYHLGRSS